MAEASGRVVVGSSTHGSRIGLAVLGLVLVALLVGPWWMGADWQRRMATFFAYAALASLWNLLAGYAGLVSVGQQAFVGLGAYALYSFAVFAKVPPLLAIPLAGLCAAIVAGPVALLTFRLRGAYFAIGTWVVAEVFRLMAAQIGVLGGGSGISLPVAVVLSLGHRPPERLALFFWLGLGLFLMVLGGIVLLLRSRYGLALTAIRDSEIAARSNGIDVGRIKLIVYVLVAFATGMIGAWIALQKMRISPDSSFDVNNWTALVIFMTVIGGVGSLEGPVLGCIVYYLLRDTLANLGSVYLMILGAVAIVVMLRAPKGLWGLVSARFGWQIIPLRRQVRRHG